MSTPCLYHFQTTEFVEEGEVRDICTVYRHWDGYLACSGAELAVFLTKHDNEDPEKLTARFIAEFFEAGSLYIDVHVDADYEYTVRYMGFQNGYRVCVTAPNVAESGTGWMTVEEFFNWIEENKGKEYEQTFNRS